MASATAAAATAAACPLTRNLYREDEVLAALRWCTIKGRAQEAIFWAQEALDSGLYIEVLDALFWVWCFSACITNLTWLQDFRRLVQKGPTATTHDDIQRILMGLLRGGPARRDGTVIALLGLGLIYESQIPTLKDAIDQAKPLDAWVLSKDLWPKMPVVTWTLLKDGSRKRADAREAIHMLETLPQWYSNGSMWVWVTRAAATAIATCATASPSPDWLPPVEWVLYPQQWFHLPMRFRRIHIIPAECLYWQTGRGELAVTETTDRDLTHNLEAALQLSVFWKDICPTPMSDDDYRMDFYDTYYQNDIPDEWSAEDRAKSHGAGPLPYVTADRTIVFQRCLERWFGGLPCNGLTNVEDMGALATQPEGKMKAALAALMNDWPRINKRPIGLVEQINRAYE